jgi:hypothetical protein
MDQGFMCQGGIARKRMVRHVRQEHSWIILEDETFACPFVYCGQAYAKIGKLCDHMRMRHVLSDVKSCCGLLFANVGGLWRHQHDVHPKMLIEKPSELYWNRVQLVSSNASSSATSTWK